MARPKMQLKTPVENQYHLVKKLWDPRLLNPRVSDTASLASALYLMEGEFLMLESNELRRAPSAAPYTIKGGAIGGALTHVDNDVAAKVPAYMVWAEAGRSDTTPIESLNVLQYNGYVVDIHSDVANATGVAGAWVEGMPLYVNWKVAADATVVDNVLNARRVLSNTPGGNSGATSFLRAGWVQRVYATGSNYAYEVLVQWA